MLTLLLLPCSLHCCWLHLHWCCSLLFFMQPLSLLSGLHCSVHNDGCLHCWFVSSHWLFSVSSCSLAQPPSLLDALHCSLANAMPSALSLLDCHFDIPLLQSLLWCDDAVSSVATLRFLWLYWLFLLYFQGVVNSNSHNGLMPHSCITILLVTKDAKDVSIEPVKMEEVSYTSKFAKSVILRICTKPMHF